MISTGRLWTSIGAGGVLYLSPLLFNELGFSGSQIGGGITIAAILGTISRLLTGFFLDRGCNYSIPLKIAAIFAVMADIFLLKADTYITYIQGQCFLGTAAGIYWPAIELAVPFNCLNYPSSKGFALARTTDALGITIGSSIGTFLSWIGAIRFIYLIDIACMSLFISLMSNKLVDNYKEKKVKKLSSKFKRNVLISLLKEKNKWLLSIIPILIISLYSTSIISLLQSGLPLDLAKGGISRPALNQSQSSLILSFGLFLLLVFQWPIGIWLSKKNVNFGLRVSLISLSLGCFLLSFSNTLTHGLIIIIFALVLIAFGITAFLPVATEGIIQISSISNRE